MQKGSQVLLAGTGSYIGSDGQSASRPTETVFTGEKGHLESALQYANTKFTESAVKGGAKHMCILTCNDDPIGGTLDGNVSPVGISVSADRIFPLNLSFDSVI